MSKVKLVSEDGQPAPTIFEFITKRRGGKNHKIGVIVGVRNGDYYGVSFAQANLKEGDLFDPTAGFGIAISRALGYIDAPKVPDGIQNQFLRFQGRCEAYFKDVDPGTAPKF